jgi:hypothetical protein
VTGGTEVFKDVRLIRPAGPELTVELHFEPSQLTIRNVGGRHTLRAVDYHKLTGAEYQESRHARVFVRTTRRWLILRGSGGEQVRLRLERENTDGILAAVEKRLGQPVVRSVPQDDR